MKADTWFPFYVSDYVGDTIRLSTEQHGAYLLLILGCWTGGGSLPADDATLASTVKLSVQAWRKMKPVLARYFIEADGVWSHKRVVRELARAKEISEKRRAAGRGGGRPRKPEESKPKPIGLQERSQTAPQKQPQTETHAPVARPLPSEDTGSSDTNVSAHGASPQERALALELRSLAGGRVDDNPDAEAWRLAVSLLTTRAGLAERQARAFFANLLKRAELRGGEMHVALLAAEDSGTPDLQPYLTQCAQDIKSGKTRHDRSRATSPAFDRRQDNLARAYGTPAASAAEP